MPPKSSKVASKVIKTENDKQKEQVKEHNDVDNNVESDIEEKPKSPKKVQKKTESVKKVVNKKTKKEESSSSDSETEDEVKQVDNKKEEETDTESESEPEQQTNKNIEKPNDWNEQLSDKEEPDVKQKEPLNVSNQTFVKHFDKHNSRRFNARYNMNDNSNDNTDNGENNKQSFRTQKFRNDRNIKHFNDNHESKSVSRVNSVGMNKTSKALKFSYNDYENVQNPVFEVASDDLIKVIIARAHKEGQVSLKRCLETVLRAMNHECDFPKEFVQHTKPHTKFLKHSKSQEEQQVVNENKDD
jgi:hypothetical protein